MSSLGTIWAELGLKLNKFDKGLREAEAKIKKAEDSLDGFRQTGERLSDVGKSLTAKVSLPIAGMGVAAVKAAIDLEDAFVGVRKVLDGTEEEFAALQKGFEDMARRIPIATKELYGIGQAAGQLGIEKEYILEFTEVMAKLGVTTNLSSEQAATALARMANITQMPKTEFDRLGATVVALGNSLATTEAEIVEMGLRLAGAGKQVGMTEAQMLALAGALSSVGIEAQAGGSAFSRTIIEIANSVASGNEKLTEFAAIAGMSVEEFSRAFQEDAANAIVTFIEGLASVSASGENTFAVLDELGLSEVRVRDAMLRAANAGDLFRKSVETGNRAWEENIALNREAELRFGTTGSQIQLFINDLQLMAKEFGDQVTPALRELIEQYVRPAIQWFGDLDDSTKKFILTAAGIAVAVGPAVWVLGGLFESIVSIRAGIAVAIPLFKSLATKFIAASTAATMAGATTTAAGTAAAVAAPAVTGLGAALNLLTGPIGLVAAGITGLILLFNKLRRSTDESKQGAKDLEAEMKRAQEEASKAAAEMASNMQAEMQKAQDAMNQTGSQATTTAAQIGTAARNVKSAFEIITESLDALDRKIEITRAEFELMMAQMDPAASEAEKLTFKLDAQKAEMTALQEKISTLSEGYEHMKNLKGENAEETQRFYLELLREQKAQAALKQEIESTNEELRKQAAIKAGRLWEAEGRAATTSELRQYADYRAVDAQVKSGGKVVGGAGDLMDALRRSATNYAGNVEAVARARNVDLGVASSMLDAELLRKYEQGLIKLAAGGIVTKPTYALIGERGPEAVIPLDRGMRGASPNITINITGNHIASDYDVDRIGEQLVRKLRLAGVLM